MTVNEVEARTGLDRATVRYYEKEGLISPPREGNGYRNYSEADIEKLLKIKLLRALDFSLEDIRAMDADGADFPDRLRARTGSLKARAEDMEDAMRVIGNMLTDGAEYASLQSGLYLRQLESRSPALPEPPPREPEQTPDPGPVPAGPWARFFARTLDSVLFNLCFMCIVLLVLRVPYVGVGWERAVVLVCSLAARLLLEPVFLRCVGATPGKLLLGMRVRGADGRNLTVAEAFRRTWGVSLWGEGLKLPLFSLWRKIKSWRDANAGLELPWENGSTVVFTSRGTWWKPLCAGCMAALVLLASLLYVDAYMPVHRGELTPAEFAENVNWYLRSNLGEGRWVLNDDGSWTDALVPRPGTVYVDPEADFVPAPVELTVEGGVVTGLSWHQTTVGNEAGAERVHSQYARALTVCLVGADRSLGLPGFLGLESKMAASGSTPVLTACGPWRVWCYDVFRHAAEDQPDAACSVSLVLERIDLP